MGTHYIQSFSRRNVLNHGLTLAASGTFLLAGCVDDKAEVDNDTQTDDEPENATFVPRGDGPGDERESSSDDTDEPSADDNTAVVPMQLEVSLSSTLTMWDLPFEEMEYPLHTLQYNCRSVVKR